MNADASGDTRRPPPLYGREWFLRLLAVLLGLFQAWANRNVIEVDAVSYLDIADAFLRRDWATMVNGCWNPLFAILLSPAVHLARAFPHLEYPLVHLTMFMIYLAALFAFGFFLREFLSVSARIRGDDESARASKPEWPWITLGYALFLWSSLDLVRVSETNPDMVVAALVYVATGLLLRIRRESTAWWPYALLGLVLGLAYLTKSFMFVGALIFLGTAGVIVRHFSGGAWRLALAIAVFLAVCLPYAAALSAQRGRLTIGEAGRLNYVWHVNGVRTRNWQGGPPEAGQPLHPTRKILEVPATYEFSRPIPVTYPLWFDPSYWYDGVRVVFRPYQQARTLVRNLLQVSSFVFGLSGTFAVCLLILLVLGPRWRDVLRALRSHWQMIAPSLLAVALYTVVHVEPRYVAAFLAIILMVCFVSLWAGGGPSARAVIQALGPVALIVLVLPASATGGAPRFYSITSPVRVASVDSPAEMLASTRALGLMPGAKVATTEYGNRGAVRWARLARVQIIAEVRADENGRSSFWDLTAGEQELVLEAVSRLGAVAIVSDSKPQCPVGAEWVQLRGSDYYVRILKH